LKSADGRALRAYLGGILRKHGSRACLDTTGKIRLDRPVHRLAAGPENIHAQRCPVVIHSAKLQRKCVAPKPPIPNPGPQPPMPNSQRQVFVASVWANAGPAFSRAYGLKERSRWSRQRRDSATVRKFSNAGSMASEWRGRCSCIAPEHRIGHHASRAQ